MLAHEPTFHKNGRTESIDLRSPDIGLSEPPPHDYETLP